MLNLNRFTRELLESIPGSAKYFFNEFKQIFKVDQYQLPLLKPNDFSSLFTEYIVEGEFNKRTLESLVNGETSYARKIRLTAEVRYENFKFYPHLLSQLSIEKDKEIKVSLEYDEYLCKDRHRLGQLDEG